MAACADSRRVDNPQASTLAAMKGRKQSEVDEDVVKK